MDAAAICKALAWTCLIGFGMFFFILGVGAGLSYLFWPHDETADCEADLRDEL
jgi:hypothetical protein